MNPTYFGPVTERRDDLGENRKPDFESQYCERAQSFSIVHDSFRARDVNKTGFQ